MPMSNPEPAAVVAGAVGDLAPRVSDMCVTCNVLAQNCTRCLSGSYMALPPQPSTHHWAIVVGGYSHCPKACKECYANFSATYAWIGRFVEGRRRSSILRVAPPSGGQGQWWPLLVLSTFGAAMTYRWGPVRPSSM